MNHGRHCCRNGLTLAEVLVAASVTALLTAALSAALTAVTQAWDFAADVSQATQAARVGINRISHKTATSLQVLPLPAALLAKPDMDQVLIVWERDGEPTDVSPGQANFNELVIYAPHKKYPTQLMELRPQVDPALVVDMNQPAVLADWIDRFRDGDDVQEPPVALINNLGGVRFDVEEHPQPQGIGGIVQQNVRIVLCLNRPAEPPVVFIGSATRRYVP